MIITDLLLLKGTVAQQIHTKNYSLISPLTVLFAATLYTFAAGYTSAVPGNLAIFLLFAYMHMIAFQSGLSLLLWAMCKLFRGTSSLIQVFVATGYTFLPYGIIIASHTLLTAGILPSPFIQITAILAAAYFVYLLYKTIQLFESFPPGKALACISSGILFFASFIYLFVY